MKKSPIDKFLNQLHGLRPNGSGWTALCPAHEDYKPSLSIKEGDDGRVLIFCHAGCDYQDVLAALGFKKKDLFV